jgi:hypothetical protein
MPPFRSCVAIVYHTQAPQSGPQVATATRPGGASGALYPGVNLLLFYPGALGVNLFFNLRGRRGVGVGVKQGPKNPHLGGQLRLAPRRAAGRCRGGGRAAPCFRCVPLHPGTVKWGP